MSSSARRRRASLATYLSSPTVPVSLPSLPSDDLQHALNAQKYTSGNNDVLEFIGDRVVNLACALMASKINHSPEQQTLYARRLSNNDTLGRIAHQLRLPQHASARLDRADRCAAENWSRHKVGSPPKLFADLFESYMGALFLRYGWHYAHAWLKKVYEPIIAAASRDAFSTTEVAPLLWSVPDAQPWPQHIQWDFEDFIDERETEMKDAIMAVMQSLPRSEVSSRREEVGMQLIKLWICELAFGVYPEIHSARDRGAHFLSCITNALMSLDTLGHLGLLLSLSSYLPPSDPDFLVGSIKDKDAGENFDRAKLKVAGILKALIGAFYLRHPTRARKWGHGWLRPLVCWTMGTLLRVGRFRPIIGPSPPASPEPTPSAKNESNKPETPIDALLKTFEHLAIDSKSKLKTHKKTSSKTSNELQKTKSRPKKYTIKINAPWLFGYEGSGDHTKDDERKLHLDLDIELDPYKLLDEGDMFPVPESKNIDTPNGDNEDEVKKEEDNSTLDSKQPEEVNTKGTTDPVDQDSDGSQDMEFSSSSSETDSDMEFSSEEEDAGIVQADVAEDQRENKEDGDKKKEDGLTRALERLDINSSGIEKESGNGGSMSPATRSEGPSSSSSEPSESKPLESSKSSETQKGEPITEEDELEDMEFSSSEESVVEDSGEKDMEFSSDEEKVGKVNIIKVANVGAPSTTMLLPKSKEKHPKDASTVFEVSRTPSKLKKVRIPLASLPLDANVEARIRQRAQNTPQLGQGPGRRKMSNF